MEWLFKDLKEYFTHVDMPLKWCWGPSRWRRCMWRRPPCAISGRACTARRVRGSFTTSRKHSRNILVSPQGHQRHLDDSLSSLILLSKNTSSKLFPRALRAIATLGLRGLYPYSSGNRATGIFTFTFMSGPYVLHFFNCCLFMFFGRN